jgi:hypothetical protein
MGGPPILIHQLLSHGAIPTRRATLGDVRHIAYDLLEEEMELCPTCVVAPPPDAQLRDCCHALRQRVALKVRGLLDVGERSCCNMACRATSAGVEDVL